MGKKGKKPSRSRSAKHRCAAKALPANGAPDHCDACGLLALRRQLEADGLDASKIGVAFYSEIGTDKDGNAAFTGKSISNGQFIEEMRFYGHRYNQVGGAGGGARGLAGVRLAEVRGGG